jgi:hypothetical protein
MFYNVFIFFLSSVHLQTDEMTKLEEPSLETSAVNIPSKLGQLQACDILRQLVLY